MRVRDLLFLLVLAATALLAIPLPALAAGGDCPLVPTLDNFDAASPPQVVDYGAENFRVVTGNSADTVAKQGKICRQDYNLHSGARPMTDLEIMRNYTEGLPSLGFKITNTDRNPDQTIFATINKDGADYWVRVSPSNGNGLHIIVLQVAAFRSTIVPLAARDCPPVPGLRDCEANGAPDTRTFGDEDFRVVEGNAAHNVTKAGATCVQDYGLRQGIPNKTDLEIMQNYAEALPAAGFRITNTDRDESQTIFATVTKDGVESWVRVSPSNCNGVHVRVVRIEPFRSTIVRLAAKDCPPVPGLRDFEPGGPPDTRTFGDEDFRVVENNAAHNVTKTGATCVQNYALRQGIPNKTDLEIMKNYAEALPAAGFRITNTDREDRQTIFATMTKDGVETWVRVSPSNGNGVNVRVVRIEPFRSTIVPLAAKDCPPVPGLRDFEPGGPPDTRTFGNEDFRVVEGNAAHNVTKTGATCVQNYALRHGIANKTDLEIMKNYADALPAIGFKITNTDRSESQTIFATMTKDGVENWVRVSPSNGNGVNVRVVRIEPFRSTIVPLAAKDCPPVPGLRDFDANGAPDLRNFNAMEFRVVEGNAAHNVSKQGRTCEQNYGLRQGIPNKTDLEIMKNYAEALPALGFKITNTDRGDSQTIFATMTKDGVETWLRVSPSNGNGMHVAVLQIEPFHSSLKAPQVAAPAPPPKAQLAITAQRGGKPVAGAWCAAFAPGSVTDPAGRAQSGEMREVAPGSYDVGCFIDENGGTTSGWLKNQAVGAGAVALVVEMPPLRRVVPDLTLPAPAATAETVRPAQGDFPYLPSIPGSKLISGRADPTPVYVQPADAKQPELVANGSIIKEYQSPPGVGLAALLSAYHTALLQAHWTIVNEFHRDGVVLIVHYGDNGRNIWGNLHLAETAYTIIVADATIDQGKLAADLGSKCHLALTGVLFDFNKATLKPESDAVLQQVGALMSRDGNLRLEVQGHTDSVGSDAYNQPLSEARARSVVVWLTQHGVGPNRLMARGYGKTRPIASNDNDAERAQNRRVEIADPACRH